MFKYKSLLAAATLVALIMVGCNENTTTPTDTVPNPPTGLMASSNSSSKITVKWTPPTAGTFTGYKLRITGTGLDTTVTINDKTTIGYFADNLTNGVKYTFAVSSVNGTATSATAATISWSPASRFTQINGNDIRIYESSSTKGSGLRLYNDVTKSPEVLNVSGGSLWDIGFDNKGIADSIDTGSPGALSFTIAPRRVTLMGKIYSNVTSLDDIYETADLTVGTDEGAYTLPNNAAAGYCFVLKTADGNFAKVLVKSVGGKILQGTAPDRYCQVEVSYQTTKNVGHAEVKGTNGK
ncbi:MAG: fibronectin type III domain-containing protein [Candidatus Kapaibacterium sp.]